jgi:divalent metal cation (Fe/Co/Zn/Cd) transporter
MLRGIKAEFAEAIRVDMLADAVVLVGFVPSLAGFNLDRIAAVVVVFFIAWAGGKILIDGVRVLLDASLDYQTLSSAEKLILAEPQVIEIQFNSTEI